MIETQDYTLNTKETLEMNKYINEQEGLRRVAGKRELYMRLLKGFAQSNYLERVIHAWQNHDYKKLQNYVHMVKGVAGNLALTELYEKTKVVDEQLRENNPKIRDFSLMIACMADTINYINSY